VDEHKLLLDIERLLKRDIPKVVLEGYQPDPRIRPEPIQNGRGERGRAHPPARSEGRGRGKATAARSADAPRSSRPKLPEEQHSPAKPVSRRVHRVAGDAPDKPQHRRPGSRPGQETAALLGGTSRDD
jgi:ATP-dependent RNA helicase RhlE